MRKTFIILMLCVCQFLLADEILDGIDYLRSEWDLERKSFLEELSIISSSHEIESEEYNDWYNTLTYMLENQILISSKDTIYEMTEYFISEPKTKENQADFISIMNKFYSMQAYSLLLGFAEYWNGSESDVFYDENYYSSLLALIEKTHKNLVEAQDIYVEKYFK